MNKYCIVGMRLHVYAQRESKHVNTEKSMTLFRRWKLECKNPCSNECTFSPVYCSLQIARNDAKGHLSIYNTKKFRADTPYRLSNKSDKTKQ